MYTIADATKLSASLNGFPLSELHAVCLDRFERLRASAFLETHNALVMQNECADQVSFLLLAYACCLNHAQWFVHHEARMLLRKAEGLDTTDLAALLDLLQVHAKPLQAALAELQAIKQKRDKSALSEAETSHARGLQALIRYFAAHVVQKAHVDVTEAEWDTFHAVDFEHVPRMVAAREVAIHNGIAIAHKDQLLKIVQHTYEVRLTAFCFECKRHLELISKTNTEYYAPQFATILSTLADVQRWVCPEPPCVSGRLTCTAKTLPLLIAKFAPLCITRLTIRLCQRGHLFDKERVTLRLFLRAVHVDRDVAIEFWGQHVPEKENVRGALAQAYAKQYSCVGCGKIRASGLCPFEDSSKNLLAWCADTAPSAIPDIEDILARTSCASERCSRVFALRHARFGAELAAPRNPALYFSRAIDLDGSGLT